MSYNRAYFLWIQQRSTAIDYSATLRTDSLRVTNYCSFLGATVKSGRFSIRHLFPTLKRRITGGHFVSDTSEGFGMTSGWIYSEYFSLNLSVYVFKEMGFIGVGLGLSKDVLSDV